MKRIISLIIIFALCFTFCITAVGAISVEDVDYKYFPFDTIPLPGTFDPNYESYTNLQLFYYDYVTGTYYATFTENEVNLLYSLSLRYDTDLGGYRSGNIYQSDENGKPYNQITLMYSNDTYEWSVYTSGQQYAKILCVTEENDILYYGGSVEFVRDHVGGGSSMDEDTTKKWYDYIIDGIKEVFKPVTDFIDWFWEFEDLNGRFDRLYTLFEEISSKFDSEGDGGIVAPVIEFFGNISDGALELFAPLWDLPIIKDLLIATVSILLIGGIFILLKSL